MQLIAYGAQDIYLTGNPQITFFKVVYRRHTNFSMECIQQNINGNGYIGNTSINNKSTVTISRNGDLVVGVYIKCDQNNVGICGDHLVDDVEVEIGGQRIDRHTREWNQIWNELTIPVSKQKGFKYMVGGFNNSIPSSRDTGYPGTNQGSISYPLNFWFCRNPGLALPLIALQYHEVQLKITWGNGIVSSGNESLTRDNTRLINPLPVEVWVDYIYLDTDERRRFSQVSHEYLIEQLQVQREKDMCKDIFKLNLEHPIKELIWTTPTDSPIIDQKIRIEINGHDRFSEQEKEYFTLKQPYEHHTSIPGYNIKEVENPYILSINENGGIYAIANINEPSLSSIKVNECGIGYKFKRNSSGDMLDLSNEIIIDNTKDKDSLSVEDDSTKCYMIIINELDIFKPKIGDIIQVTYLNSDGVTRTVSSTTTKQSMSITRYLTVLSTTTYIDSNNINIQEIRFSSNILSNSNLTTMINNSQIDDRESTISDIDPQILNISDQEYDIISFNILGRKQNPQSNCSQLKKDIYVYSFCLEPEEHQPSGTCNFSRIDSAKLILSSDGCISNIYAINYNVLRIMSGMGGLAYSS